MTEKNTKSTGRKSTSTKQTTIGKAEYINKETGEVETFNVISEYDQDFNFQKIWLTHLLDSLDILGGAKVKVLKYLLDKKNGDNQIIGTQRAIAKDVGVSLPIVNQTIGALVNVDALKKVSNGVLMLNPDFIFKGSKSRRMNILLRYNKIETIEHENEQLELPELDSTKETKD